MTYSTQSRSIASPTLYGDSLDQSSISHQKRLYRPLTTGGLAIAAALSTYSATVGLRVGAVVALICLLPHLPTYRPGKADLATFGLMLWALLSQAWAIDLSISRLGAINYIAAGTYFLAARVVVRQAYQIRIIAIGYLAGCIYVLGRILAGNSGARLSLEPSIERYGIEGVNANYSAYALATGFLAIAFLWAGTRSRILSVGLILLAALIATGIAQTGTRGAQVSVLALLLWIAVSRVSPILGLRVITVGTIVCALGIVTGHAEAFLRLIESVSSRTTGDLSSRLLIWPIARDQLGSAALFGQGANSFAATNPLGRVSTHNIVLELALGLGLVGLVLAIVAWSHSLFPKGRTLVHSQRFAAGAYIAVTAPIALSGMWDQSAPGWLFLALTSRAWLLGTPSPHFSSRQGSGAKARFPSSRNVPMDSGPRVVS